MNASLDLSAWPKISQRTVLLQRLQRHVREGVSIPADLVIAVGLDCPHLIRTDQQRQAALAVAVAVLHQQRRYFDHRPARLGQKGTSHA